MTHKRAVLFTTTLLLSACSVDSVAQNLSAPAALDPSTTSTTTTTTRPETSTTSTTATPPPTIDVEAALPVATTVPVALAFRSEADMGGLYETKTLTGLLGTSAAPGASFGGITVVDGTLVEVKEVVRQGSQLWVRIAAPVGDTSDLGWALANDLVETDQAAIDRPWSLVRRFSTIVPNAPVGGAAALPVVIRNTPDKSGEIVSEASSGDLVHTGGSQGRTASGETFVELTVAGSNNSIGWIPAANVQRVESLVARYADGSNAPLSNPGLWPIGALTVTPAVVGGCGGLQITIASAGAAADGVGSHVRFGPVTPAATWTGAAADIVWSFGAEERSVFIRPGGAVTLTIPASEPSSWFFMSMGAADDAPWLVDENGEPVLGPGDSLQPTRVDQVAYDPNTCTANKVG